MSLQWVPRAVASAVAPAPVDSGVQAASITVTSHRQAVGARGASATQADPYKQQSY